MNSISPRAWGLGLAGGCQAPLSPESDAGLGMGSAATAPQNVQP